VEEEAAVNIGLIAGGAAAGGVVLLIGVAFGRYCRGKPEESAGSNVHVVTHVAPTVNPLPGTPMANPYPTAVAQLPSASAYPTNHYAPSTVFATGQVQLGQ